MLTSFSIAAVGLGLGYAGLQTWFLYGWTKVREPRISQQWRRWSIVIAARNEAAALDRDDIHSLLGGLAPDWHSYGQLRDSPPYEVILVDDHSTDGTADAAGRFPHVRVLVLPKGLTGKKAALTYGVAHATGDWIATLDADVTLRQDWLRNLDSATEGRVAVAGPVQLYDPHDTWFGRWQALDFCGMMLITGASLAHGHFAMGNGANLAFAKTAYDAVDGYAPDVGQPESASGDDMVLLGKLLRRFPGQVGFSRDPYTAARTAVQPDVGSFVRQRWRWSAKTGLNHQPALTAVLGLTWVFHVGLLVGFPLAAAGWLAWEALGVAWACKFVADFVLLWVATRAFWREGLLDWTYPLQSVAHAVYVAGVGALALLPLDFEWKGRRWRV